MTETQHRVVGIDPGSENTTACVLRCGPTTGISIVKLPNEEFLQWLTQDVMGDTGALYVVEGIASYGMPVGREVFDTCMFVGRIVQAIRGVGGTCHITYRKTVVTHICGSARAKDANVRQALIDLYGKPGTRKNPGLTYGVTKDGWSALAVATWASDNLHTLQGQHEHHNA